MGDLLHVLRNRNLQLLLSARLVSSTGDWLYVVALTVAVYGYSHGSTFLVGLFWVARLIPTIVIRPFTGALADRVGYRRTMIAADLGRMVLVGLLAAVLSASTWAIMYPLAVAVTILTSIFVPASAGMIPSMVRSKEERLAANAVTIQISSIATVLGSALGGLAAGLHLISGMLWIEAATFGVSALSLFFIHAGESKRAGREKGPGVLAGFAVLTKRPPLVFASAVMAMPELASGAFLVWVVPYAVQISLGSAGVGYLYAAMGVGMALGGFLATALGTGIALDAMLAASVIFTGVAYVAFGLTSLALVGLVAAGAIGIAQTVEYAAYETLLQQSVPEELIGQAAGTMDSLFFDLMLVGNLVAGLLAARLGLGPSIIAIGAACSIIAVAGWGYLQSRSRNRPTAELLTGVPAFARTPLNVREWAVRRMVREQFPAGTVIVRQGDPGDQFYVIASGQVAVDVRQDGLIATSTLGPGQFFGEIALLQNVPRTATVTARDNVTVYAMSREDFTEMHEQASVLKESLLEVATSRLQNDANLKMALLNRS